MIETNTPGYSFPNVSEVSLKQQAIVFDEAECKDVPGEASNQVVQTSKRVAKGTMIPTTMYLSQTRMFQRQLSKHTTTNVKKARTWKKRSRIAKKTRQG